MTRSLFERARARQKSAGVAIITAIFLLVVVAGLGVAAISLVTSQQDASAKDMQGQRAYQAARAGVEWAALAWQLNGRSPAGPVACGASNSFVPAAVTLASFTVTVSIVCDATVGGVAGGAANNDPTANHFSIISIACNQPVNNACPNGARGADYVQRVLRAQL